MEPLLIHPAHRTEEITYAVRDVVVLAEKAAKRGLEMLYLNIGDPNVFDFRTPPHIVEAACKAMTENKNGYAHSSGIKEGLAAIEKDAEKKGIRNIRDIFITTGVSEAIDLCLTALVNEGENVLSPSPGYPLYGAILKKLNTVDNPYYLDESNGWQPDVEEMASKINAKTRAIILINPNNPTGSVCSKEVLEKIIALAAKHNLIIFADEIYDRLLLDGDTSTSLASLNSDVPIITFNGLSKSYLVPGFRIGWGIVSGNSAMLTSYIEAVNKLLRARVCANHPMQYAIKPALEGDQSHLVDMRHRLARRRDITCKMLNSIPEISVVKPLGAFYAFASLNIRETDNEFVRALIEETGVVVVAGSGFGQVPGSKHFRVVFLPDENKLMKAYEKILDFVTKFSKR
ncbi:aminotransferase class I/II-fold pyridoxal phosphate-dependent enzyme [bacterium]|nr:aminotransferase class I/II-fold pyridoxal phosphate-dependent enzyme [bacterium]